MSALISLITALWLTPVQTPTYKVIIPVESSANAQKLPPLQIFSETLVFATSSKENVSDEVLDTKTLITKYSKEYGTDLTMALNIARAESNFKNVPNLYYNGEDGYYTAYGIFQLTKGFYKKYCGDPIERMDVEKNIECAMKVLAQPNGYLHWMESYEMDGAGWKYQK